MALDTRRTQGWEVGRAFGARVIVQPASLAMMAVLAFLWGGLGTGGLSSQSLGRGAALAGMLLASVLMHELAHAAAASAFRHRVHEIVLTLWGGHTSYASDGARAHDTGLISAAGPALNALLGLAGLGASRAGAGTAWEEPLGWFATVNLLLALFNALPGLPMDGGRVLEALVWGATKRRTTGVRVAAWAGRLVAVGAGAFIALSGVIGGRGVEPLDVALGVLVFMLLWPAATAALRNSRTLERIDHLTVGRLMRPAVGVHHGQTLEQALAEAERAGAAEVVVLAADGRPAAHFPVAGAVRTAAERSGQVALAALSVPIPHGAVLPATATGLEMLALLREWWERADVMAVVDDDQVVGVLVLRDVSQWLRDRSG